MSSEMERKFDLARWPIDTAKAVGQAAVWPLHVSKTLATNAVDTAFKIAGTNTEDVPHPNPKAIEGKTVYDVAKSNLDVSAMIYYYTELRSEIKILLRSFASDKNIDFEKDVPVLQGAFKMVSDRLAALEGGSTAVESTSSPNGKTAKAVKDYRQSLADLEGLCERFELTTADREILKTYFDVLKQPKDISSVYSDLVLYDRFIDAQFRFAFGGTEWNRKNVEDMMKGSDDISIHYIDDEFNTSSLDLQGALLGVFSEVVWAIVINKTTKTLTVVFRGSINVQDWIVDLSVNMVDCVLPGYTSEETVDKGHHYGRVHEGFYRYMFAKTRKGANGSTKSKGEEIVGMLRGLLDQPEYSDYSVTVTGHSLGGSLSTIFAFRCACQGDFGDSMITNISFASPFVGDAEFRAGFVALERKRKIRHLRVSNYQDIVPTVPACTLPIPNGIEPFKHVGMNIRLYEGGDFAAPSYRRFYPKEDDLANGLRNAFHNNIPLGLSVGIIGKHLLPEYDKRLSDEGVKEELSKLTLDHLYGDADITGWEYTVPAKKVIKK